MPVYTLGDIASKINGKLIGDPDIEITGTAEIDKADTGKITFLSNPKYRDFLHNTGASAIIIDEKANFTPEIPHIRVVNAYFGFLQTFLLFNPQPDLLKPGIHPTAVIEETAELGKDVAIGAYVYIGRGVRIGSRTKIFPNSVILSDSKVGEDCILYPLVSVRENCQIGNRVIIHNGAVIGSDGFGFAPYEGRFHKIPQIGRVIIEDDVEIGANCTIDRATMGETVIKTGVKLDNLIQVAHNVIIGEHTVIAAQTGISGSTRIGRQVMIGGQVGIVGHITIGDGVQIGAQSGVAKSVADGEIMFGSPARQIGQTKRIEAALARLPELLKRIHQLEKEVEYLQKK